MAETTYDTPVGTKAAWVWDKCDYDLAETCPVGSKAAWAWAVPSVGVNETIQGADSAWIWNTT